MPIRRSDCVPLPVVVCPVVAVVMLESRVARCVHCVENVASGNILHTVHTSCHPTLQHHNSYNRTDNYRQWNAVGSPDGHKDARNMLIYYWLPINHYLLHLVGLTFTYLSKMHGHSNIKFPLIKFNTDTANFTGIRLAISRAYTSTCQNLFGCNKRKKDVHSRVACISLMYVRLRKLFVWIVFTFKITFQE
jgi:hypothetical protein